VVAGVLTCSVLAIWNTLRSIPDGYRWKLIKFFGTTKIPPYAGVLGREILAIPLIVRRRFSSSVSVESCTCIPSRPYLWVPILARIGNFTHLSSFYPCATITPVSCTEMTEISFFGLMAECSSSKLIFMSCPRLNSSESQVVGSHCNICGSKCFVPLSYSPFSVPEKKPKAN
jgi:hypothetical protein